MNRVSVRGVFVAVLVVAAALAGQSARAQQAGQWSPQQRIPQYDNESRAPYLLADSNRTVHVFNTQALTSGNANQAIFYRQWSLDRGWSDPTDIVLSPLAGAPAVQGAYLDRAGTMHLIFFAGNERAGGIYYMHAPAVDAARASAWSVPVEIGPDAGPLASSGLIGDDQGNLFVVYGGRHEGAGLYGVQSRDGGRAWMAPQVVFLTYADALWPSGLRIALDGQSRLHVVWSMVNQQGIDLAIYYARLEADHAHWSAPFLLAQRIEGDYKSAWPAIAIYHDTLVVMYQKGSPATREMRTSGDGGQTWSTPVRPWPNYEGEYENPVLLIDSLDRLHVVTGNRLSGTDCCHGMWHAMWLGDHWGDLEGIVVGPKTLQFDPSAPRAVISQGNVILATWWTDTGGGPRNGAWYSYAVLDAPELPVAPLAQPTAVPAATATPGTPTVVPAEMLPADSPQLSSALASDSSSPALPLEVSLLSIAGVIAIVFVVRRLRA
jgi:hypothetical protein